jgi:hypothetical protein
MKREITSKIIYQRQKSLKGICNDLKNEVLIFDELGLYQDADELKEAVLKIASIYKKQKEHRKMLLEQGV